MYGRYFILQANQVEYQNTGNKIIIEKMLKNKSKVKTSNEIRVKVLDLKINKNVTNFFKLKFHS